MSSTSLRRDRDYIQRSLDEAIAEGIRVSQSDAASSSDAPAFKKLYDRWEKRTAALLSASFNPKGFTADNPRSEFQGTSISLLDLRMPGAKIPAERLPEFIADIEAKTEVLNSIKDRLEFYAEENGAGNLAGEQSFDGPIFVVHGHEDGKREIVRRFLEKTTNRKVIILADEPNQGHDLLGKLLNSAENAGFAVVLLTPDDIGRSKAEETESSRARQNVIFELGLFIGLLGRSRVAALKFDAIEIPTDFAGVVYVDYDDQWQIKLARELTAAGIETDLHKML